MSFDDFDDVNEFRYGHLSLDEWDGLWKSDESDPSVFADDGQSSLPDYGDVFFEFTRRLGSLGKVGCGGDCDFYFGGNFIGDRTQWLEIPNVERLTLDLVEQVQSWLREPAYRMYRVIVRNYVSYPAALIIYPEVVRFGIGFASDLPKALDKIRRILRLGIRTTTATYFVEDVDLAELRRSASKSDEWRYSLRYVPWAEIYCPGNWISNWSVSVAAREAYIAVRQECGRATSPRKSRGQRLLSRVFQSSGSKAASAWDRFIDSVVPASIADFADLGPEKLFVDWKSKEVSRMAHTLAQLRFDEIELAWDRTIVPTDKYMSRFSEFREFVRSWVELVESAAMTGRGVVCLGT